MKIVELTTLHVQSIAKFQERYFKDGWSKENLISSFETGRCFGYLAEIDGEVIAFILLNKNYDDADLESICVKPDLRKTGIGSNLLSLAIKKSKDLGLNAIFLEVRKSNIIAKKLYEKFDFVFVSERKKYYADGENALVMKREIV